MCTHLFKRGSVYYFRRKIPVDLLPHYEGKKEILRSLRTKDRREAERLARETGLQLDDEFEELRAKLRGDAAPQVAPGAGPGTAPGTAPAPRRPDTDYIARRYLAYLRTARDLDVPEMHYLLEHWGEVGAEEQHERNAREAVQQALEGEYAALVIEGAEDFLDSLAGVWDLLDSSLLQSGYPGYRDDQVAA